MVELLSSSMGSANTRVMTRLNRKAPSEIPHRYVIRVSIPLLYSARLQGGQA